MEQTLIFLTLILLLPTFIMTNCPPQCATCMRKIISCKINGLPEIPSNLQPSTEQIILIGQYNFQSVLTSRNFTELAWPKYNITVMAIRSSSIQELSPQTFTSLRILRELDLSSNQILTIQNSAFYKLKLKILVLSDIGKLILKDSCFQGLQVETLSIVDSRLQSLEYRIFEPISNSLKHLYLENNQIRTIDKKFENLFYQLKIVKLKDNPLMCYCPLRWLSKALSSKLTNSNSNKFSDSQSIDSDQPKCAAPTALRMRKIPSISEAEFNCFIPKIAQIEIDMISMYSGKMSCRIAPTESEQKIPTRVFWKDNNVELNRQDYTDKFKNPLYPKTDKRHSVAIYNFNYNNKNPQKQQGWEKQLTCVAENNAGRNSVLVHFSWLNTNYSYKGFNIDSTTDTNTNENRDKAQNKNKNNINNNNNLQSQSNGNKKHKIDYNSNVNQNNSYLFHKQYTLLEMTAAIIGTFVVTVLLFLLVYKLYFRRKSGYKSGKKTLAYSLHHSDNNNTHCLKGHTNNHQALLDNAISKSYLPYDPHHSLAHTNNTNTTTNKNSINHHQNQLGQLRSNGFGVYEGSGHYSDNSFTYDSIPQNLSSTIFTPVNNNNNNNSSNNPINTSTHPSSMFNSASLNNSPSAHFIDYKTHKNLYPTNPHSPI